MNKASWGLIVVGALVLAGCGGTGAEVDGGNGSGGGGGSGDSAGAGGGIGASFDREALSGTRLKQRYLQGDDGARTPLGFFDTTRNENCTFALAEDGEQRCVPLEGATFLTSTFFYDSGCTERVASLPSGCAMPKYAVEYLTQCPGGVVVSAATVYTPTMATLFGKNAGTCNAVNPASFPTYTFLRIGAKVPASSFARAVVMVEP